MPIPQTANNLLRTYTSVMQFVQLRHLRGQGDPEEIQADPPAGVGAAGAREVAAVRVEAGRVGHGEEEGEAEDEQDPGRPLDEVLQVDAELGRDVDDHAVE